MNEGEELNLYIGDITFDVCDPGAMAEFWGAALGYEIQEITDEFASIVDPTGRRPRCCFQKVETRKTAKNRVHLDLFASDMQAEVARLETLGAPRLRAGCDNGVVWTVMLDVEGNEFCVQPPQW